MPSSHKHSLSSLVKKATDASLLEDNWGYITSVFDKVSEDPEENEKLVVSLLSERLQQRDANVQLRSLSLLTAVGENCGSRAKQEIASKAFTSMLLSKLADSTIHKDIKERIVQVITQLAGSFKNDISLKPIQDAYHEVTRNYSRYSPQATTKKPTYNDKDRLREEEDLKAALELSLKETSAPQQAPPAQQPVAQPQTPKSVSRVRAVYDSIGDDPTALKFYKGDVIRVIEKLYGNWGKGSLRGVVGLFPFNYVTPIYDPTPEELAKEVQHEDEILQKSQQVDRLLDLLTTVSNPDDAFRFTNSAEFRTLYHEIVLIKPELASIIDKHRERKAELLDLHKNMKEASAIYEDLNDPLKYQYQQHQSYYSQVPSSQQPHPQQYIPQQQPLQTPYSPQALSTPQSNPLQAQHTSSSGQLPNQATSYYQIQQQQSAPYPTYQGYNPQSPVAQQHTGVPPPSYVSQPPQYPPTQ